jgi:hypothetical protein
LALIEAGLGPRTQTVFTSHDFDGFGDTAASQGLGWPGCAAVALNAIAWWGANPLVQDAAPAPSVLQGGAPSKDPCGYGFPAERWQDVSFQLGGWYPDARPYAVCAAAQVLTPEPDAVPQGLAGGTTCINTSDDNWLDACVAGDGALYAWSSWEIEGAGFLGTRGHVVGAAFGDTGQAAPVCE